MRTQSDAINIFDFDGTLTPYFLPKWTVLMKCGLADGAMSPEFLEMAKETAARKGLDIYQALYDVYFTLLKEHGIALTDENFCLGAQEIEYNDGVLEFLQRLQNSGMKNYILSSGLKVYLEKSQAASLVAGIYATEFSYDDAGEANGIKSLMSDKNKVQAIKEICQQNNGREDDCTNVVYVGDGFTDYYAMEYVKQHGGATVFVYRDPESKDLAAIREKNVVDLYTLVDFAAGSELDKYISSLRG